VGGTGVIAMAALINGSPIFVQEHRWVPSPSRLPPNGHLREPQRRFRGATVSGGPTVWHCRARGPSRRLRDHTGSEGTTKLVAGVFQPRSAALKGPPQGGSGTQQWPGGRLA
jgi:hypothetical protein